MANEDYVALCLATNLDDQGYEAVAKRLSNRKMLVVLHALMGITTECGELMDQLKKHLIYGKLFDDINIMEEDGDLRWYLSLLEFGCNYSPNEAQEKNIAKLKARFPNKFTEIDALNRNLDAERRVLEDR